MRTSPTIDALVMTPFDGFGAVSAAEFLTGYWDHRPLYAPGVATGPVLALTAEYLYRAFAERGREGAGFTSYHADHRSRDDGRAAVLALWKDRRSPSVNDIIEFNRTQALIVRGAQRYFPELEQLLVGWRGFFNCPINANLYLTRPGASAFPIHFDQHHVFAVQLGGGKDWLLWPPTVDGAHGRFHFEKVEPAGDPLRLTTCPGDVLYVPLGWLHRAQTAAEMSVHATLGVTPPRWLDLIQEALDQVAGQYSLLRRGLPFRFTPSHGVEFFADPDRHVDPILTLISQEVPGRLQALLEARRESREGTSHE